MRVTPETLSTRHTVVTTERQNISKKREKIESEILQPTFFINPDQPIRPGVAAAVAFDRPAIACYLVTIVYPF